MHALLNSKWSKPVPFRKILRLPELIRFRRMLGLFAFFYACLHFTTYIWLDKFFDLSEMWKDIAKRKYITVGFTAFLLLIPLAVTSTAGPPPGPDGHSVPYDWQGSPWS